MTTFQDLATRRASAMIGLPCDEDAAFGFAQIPCRAFQRTRWLVPVDHFEYIGIEEIDCRNWMKVFASTFRSIILVGPQWQRCLVHSASAHPTTRFMTIEFCHPPELKASNVECGTFQQDLPNLEWGMTGYSPSYQAGLSYQSKIDLITAVAVKELARVRSR